MYIQLPVTPDCNFVLGFFCFFKWVDEIGGFENLSKKLLKDYKSGKLPTFIPPKVKLHLFYKKSNLPFKESKL